MNEESNKPGNPANKALIISVVILAGLVAWFGLGRYGLFDGGHIFSGQGMMMGGGHHREAFLEQRDSIMHEEMGHGDYACCLAKPCTYCIEKTPGHGEGASCHCLTDVIEGRHPCGECIGEIMEGHGNKHLSKYFARAIAEEVGEQYIGPLREIMRDKYEISIDEQL